MIKTIAIVVAVIAGFLLIQYAISPKECPSGTMLVTYENGDNKKPICKG